MRRLNRLAEVFPALLESLCPKGDPSTDIGLVDSQSVILAQPSRRFTAKVARQELANSGYCPTKNLYYHGVRIHAVGDYRPGTLPRPRYLGITPAGMNDGPALEAVVPELVYTSLYSDKAYTYLMRHPLLPFEVLTPVKKAKEQTHMDAADRLYSVAVSQVRQPIESLFNGIQDKTVIECASQVRSFRGSWYMSWRGSKNHRYAVTIGNSAIWNQWLISQSNKSYAVTIAKLNHAENASQGDP